MAKEASTLNDVRSRRSESRAKASEISRWPEKL